MKKHLLHTLFLLVLATVGFAQPNPKQILKTAIPTLKKLLAGIDLPYKMVNDSLASIPYEGENIASYQVVIQKVSDLYIIYTNLSEAIPGKLTESQYKYLLQRNDEFDLVKIGLAEDGVFYLRGDLYRSTATNAILKRIVTQVANTPNIIAGNVK
ncbi:MAG: hypothetical protein LH615_00095 [Ferruginibacter sp.]|nr:hypothetical protein [Ferruginibacter sp.]